MAARRRRKDRRDAPCYGAAEAAHYLALPASTVTAWSFGQVNMKPVIKPAQRRPPLLSFWNLVELYVLASIRRRHGVKMKRVRSALRYVRDELGIPRPFIEEGFLTDGVDLFVERYAKLINASQEGQAAMRGVLEGSLHRIDRDAEGVALRLYPWLNEPTEPKHLELCATRASGRLVVANTGVPTEMLAERFRAGESVEQLSGDYDLEAAQIEAALRWELAA